MGIRIVIADDHDIVRFGLKAILSNAGDDFEIVGEAKNGFEALQLVDQLLPDILILDLSMPDLDGFEVVRILRAMQNPVRVLIVTVYSEKEIIEGLLDDEIAGYITKDEVIDTLIPGVRSVMDGERWLSPAVQKALTPQSTG